MLPQPHIWCKDRQGSFGSMPELPWRSRHFLCVSYICLTCIYKEFDSVYFVHSTCIYENSYFYFACVFFVCPICIWKRFACVYFVIMRILYVLSLHVYFSNILHVPTCIFYVSNLHMFFMYVLHVPIRGLDVSYCQDQLQL